MATYIPQKVRTHWFETGWLGKVQCWGNRAKVHLDPTKDLHQVLLPVCHKDHKDSGHQFSHLHITLMT